jgi:hypothetical protein
VIGARVQERVRAALHTQSGELLGQTVPRHTSAAFVAFLGEIVITQPPRPRGSR